MNLHAIGTAAGRAAASDDGTRQRAFRTFAEHAEPRDPTGDGGDGHVRAPARP